MQYPTHTTGRMAVERVVSVQEFSRICEDLPNTPFIQDFIVKHRALMESKAKTLQGRFGRGAFLIHFRTLNDYQARKIQSTNQIIELNYHRCPELFIAHKRREVIIINDQMLWVPFFWIEQFFQVKEDSLLPCYPLSAAYCLMFVTYKSQKEDLRYYNCIIYPSLTAHSSDSFESSLRQLSSQTQ